MAVAALTTGATGAILTRFYRRSAVGAIPRRALWLRLSFLTLPSGAITGLVLGAVEGSPERTVNGLVSGAHYAPTALPLLAALLWLALRAERPRHGSIVAGSALRAMAAVLIAAFALLAARSVGSWRVTPEGEELVSSGAYVLACCVALVSRGVLAPDVADLRRVARIAQNRALEAHAGDEAAARRIDLGVGDETAAEMASGAAYRSVARAVEVVLGSVPPMPCARSTSPWPATSRSSSSPVRWSSCTRASAPWPRAHRVPRRARLPCRVRRAGALARGTRGRRAPGARNLTLRHCLQRRPRRRVRAGRGAVRGRRRPRAVRLSALPPVRH